MFNQLNSFYCIWKTVELSSQALEFHFAIIVEEASPLQTALHIGGPPKPHDGPFDSLGSSYLNELHIHKYNYIYGVCPELAELARNSTEILVVGSMSLH